MPYRYVSASEKANTNCNSFTVSALHVAHHASAVHSLMGNADENLTLGQQTCTGFAVEKTICSRPKYRKELYLSPDYPDHGAHAQIS